MRPRLALALLLFSLVASAHVGSPDVFLDGQAGPYSLFVMVQPPAVIPGIAQIQVRVSAPGVTDVSATPLAISGPGSTLAPVADSLTASTDDGQTFNGAVWLMQTGSMQIRIQARGSRGQGTVSVPLPALAQRSLAMPQALGALLLGLAGLLVFGLVAITGAAVREARLEPGVTPDKGRRFHGRVVMGCVLALVLALVWFGNSWWNSEARAYSAQIYKPLQIAPSLDGTKLTLRITDPGWLPFRKIDDFIPDHDHLIHLYLIREPQMDRVSHLHPEMTGPGVFALDLPSMDAGKYWLYADVVHGDGFSETLMSNLVLPQIEGRPLSGDDAIGVASPIAASGVTTQEFHLADGYTMRFDAPALAAKRAQLFRFELLDLQGKRPEDMQLYMGMLGHAAFVKTDGSVFAHVHPSGSISMAALMMTGSSHNMPSHNMTEMDGVLPNAVQFPYGFPTPGHYRIFVQMKHGITVETGVFDAYVT